jgi:hypothetical protein
MFSDRKDHEIISTDTIGIFVWYGIPNDPLWPSIWVQIHYWVTNNIFIAVCKIYLKIPLQNHQWCVWRLNPNCHVIINLSLVAQSFLKVKRTIIQYYIIQWNQDKPKVSLIQRCPHFRGQLALRTAFWDQMKCPYFTELLFTGFTVAWLAKQKRL